MVWDRIKSDQLKKERGLSFEELVQEPVLTALPHPTRGHQWLLLFEREDYVWVAPCVERGDELFLKTLYPSRKHTKMWKKGELE